MIKLETQKIKEAASKFLQKDFKILDLFYKISGDYEFTEEDFKKFNLVPDLLLKSKEKLYLAFVITSSEETNKIYEFIKQYKDFLPFKIYLVNDEELFETDAETFSKNKLLGKIQIEKSKIHHSQFSPKKAEEGKWLEMRNLGKLGEDEVISYLKDTSTQVIDLNFNSPDDTRTGIQDWRKFNKLPDGIAKNGNELFFFDAKAKRGRKFIVNERDYKLYQAKLEFLPVKIYFVILSYDGKKMKGMYAHNVNMNKHETSQQWDKNVTVDLSSELEQVQ